MKKLLSLAVLFGVVASVTACSPANISSNLRASSSEVSSMATRCIDFITGDENEVNGLLKKYDGWKVAYTSEYTTGNKSTTSMVMCFEKPYK